MENSIELIKVDRLSHVRRDQFVVLTELRDTIHLDCEQDRNSIFAERTSLVTASEAPQLCP